MPGELPAAPPAVATALPPWPAVPLEVAGTVEAGPDEAGAAVFFGVSLAAEGIAFVAAGSDP